jgi:hypothetical protein
MLSTYNDFQHWHLGNTLTWTPLRDPEIFKTVLSLDQESTLQQVMDGAITKALIKRNDPQLINALGKQKNRLNQKGLLKRFSIICYGHQESVEEIRATKAAKYKELKEKGEKEQFEEWFLNYKPDDIKKRKDKLANDNMENSKKRNKTKRANKKIKKDKIYDPYAKKTNKSKKGFFY